ncbi:MAG: hypothetical protein WC760_04315 [Bacteroidia bacterium]|jgi:hypothetical protein
MNSTSEHTFHIPVLGLAYSIDTPIKVARYGITSVVSIIKDELLEKMREHYAHEYQQPFEAIPDSDIDHRAKRITAYLNLVQYIVTLQVQQLKNQDFEPNSEITNYFELLPDHAPSRILYQRMLETTGDEQIQLQEELRKRIIPGQIQVNIMTKIDNLNYNSDKQPLPPEYADAMSALRGFANSDLKAGVVFSAGLNPRLFAYLESFKDFFPDEKGEVRKSIILKVSDYRSALIQGKLLAKRGIWVSEFRIESGLNCGGHAFPTEGYLLGPILEEFRQNRLALANELFSICNQALQTKTWPVYTAQPESRVTVQGGIGNAEEDRLFRDYYGVDATGWGSPFLLVPEATSVDEHTLNDLSHARKEDYFLSKASPLGVPFNNFRKSTSEAQRLRRIELDKPGSPCYNKHLAFDTEFTETPICQASRQYQRLKLNQLETLNLSKEEYDAKFDEITGKDCLCEGLATSALLKNHIPLPKHRAAVTICPGPNLAYFSGIFSLKQMVNHIYGRLNILNNLPRPHCFINECAMYIDYLKKELQKPQAPVSDKQVKYFTNFKTNLEAGVKYYEELLEKVTREAISGKARMMEELESFKHTLAEMQILLAGHKLLIA